jgi:hypothetical protein
MYYSVLAFQSQDMERTLRCARFTITEAHSLFKLCFLPVLTQEQYNVWTHRASWLRRNTSAFYSGDARLETLSWPQRYVVLLRPPSEVPAQYIQTGHDRFFSYITGVQPFYGKGPYSLLWAGSRPASGKICGTRNRLKYCVIFIANNLLRGRGMHNTTWRAAGWRRMFQILFKFKIRYRPFVR